MKKCAIVLNNELPALNKSTDTARLFTTLHDHNRWVLASPKFPECHFGAKGISGKSILDKSNFFLKRAEREVPQSRLSVSQASDTYICPIRRSPK